MAAIAIGAGAGLAGLIGGVLGSQVDWNDIGNKAEDGFKGLYNWINDKHNDWEKALYNKYAGETTSTENLTEEENKEVEEFFPKEEPTEEEKKNPNIPPLSPGGAIAGAMNGINNEESVTDTTNENIENTINFGDFFSELEKIQKENWEREDMIRKEAQAREDSAYQRAIRDMRLSGINPNLMNVQPASSGGGITSVSNVQSQGISEMLNITSNYLENMINNNFKGNENEKDRLIQGIGTLFMLGMLYMRGK